MIHRTLRSGARMPALGLGTFRLGGAAGTDAIAAALDAGYRHIDTAVMYDNEREVGAAIRRAGLPREKLFVTTKVWHDALAPEAVRASLARSLDRLGLDAVDLLLIHWPGREVPLAKTLAAFGEERAAARTRDIGISNFPAALVAEAVDRIGADVVVNQVEYHPFLDQGPVLAACRARGLVLTAYQPIAKGAVIGESTIEAIARRHGRTAPQVALRWLLQQEGVAAIPRSSQVEHIRANLDVFGFELAPEEMAAIDALRGGGRRVDPSWAPDWDA